MQSPLTKIVVVGSSGLVGSKLVDLLRRHGHEVVAASPCSGVNTLTGEGLVEALAGVQVVIDVTNSPSYEDEAALGFFPQSTRNLLAAETMSGAGHHITLSIVGADRLQGSGYMRAKVVQENLIRASGIPYTIVRSTQFFEFVDRLATSDGRSEVRLVLALMQPIALEDVIATLAGIAVVAPFNGVLELAGPEAICFSELVRNVLAAREDPRPVSIDPSALYFGAKLDERSLIPGPGARLGQRSFSDWLRQSISAD